MLSPQKRWLQALGLGALLFVAGGLTSASQADGVGGSEDQAGQEPVPRLEQVRAESWQELLTRDRRITFTPRTEHDARASLLEPQATDEEQATALMALGCARPEALREISTLETYLREGSPSVRMAAVLAMGELGVSVEATLVALLEDEDVRLRSCAMLAMLRTDRVSARKRIAAIAESDGPDAPLARDLLVGTIDPQVSRASWVGELLFELRWRAAQRFGLVDGISWRLRNLNLLLSKPGFLDGVVLRAAAARTELGVKDHLLRMLLEHESVASLRAATRAMPEELAALIANDLYVPRGAGAWRVMLDEIYESGNERDALALLELSLDVPEVAVEALVLLSRAGVKGVLEDLEDEWEQFTPPQRLRALEAWGVLGSGELLGVLNDFRNDPSPRVRAGVIIARARLGDDEAEAQLKEILFDPQHADFGPTLSVALRLVEAKVIREELGLLLNLLEGEDRVRVATELALQGDLSARELLADELRLGLPRGRVGARAVRALAGPSAGLHMELFLKHFPVENDLDVNIELALALLDAKATGALLFLRPALWSDPFDRGVLAALLVIQVAGMHGLRDEFHRAPVEANSRDMRRLGFALGEWGGLEEVEWLVQREGVLPGHPILQGAVLGALGRRTH